MLKIETPSYMRSNNGLCQCSMHSRCLLFLELAVNSTRFQILLSYMLLLWPPVVMHPWDIHSVMLRGTPTVTALTLVASEKAY